MNHPLNFFRRPESSHLLADTMGYRHGACTMLFNENQATAAARDAHGVAIYSEGEIRDLVFLIGSVSHMESFDPKPCSPSMRAGIDETPFAVPSIPSASTDPAPARQGQARGLQQIFPFRRLSEARPVRRGATGSHIGGVADDIAFVRSMWTIDNNHGAQLTFTRGARLPIPASRRWRVGQLLGSATRISGSSFSREPSADCCGRSTPSVRRTSVRHSACG
jgi:hypothetical protein